MGTLEPRKNVPRLVAAFGPVAAAHPGLQLLLAGADGPAKPAVLAARAALPAGIQKRVHMAGYVDERLRATLLSRASVFAYPSLYEGFGFPVIEAMAAGKPILLLHHMDVVPADRAQWKTDPFAPTMRGAVGVVKSTT